MSHFTTVVIVNKDSEEAMLKNAERLLEPFSEHLDVEPYIDMTKEELDKEHLDLMLDIKENPESYLGKMQNSGKDNNGEKVDLLSMTREEFSKWYHGKDRLYDEEGNMLTTYNPKSEWDWYQVGGRWNGELPNGDNISLIDNNFDYNSFAILTPDGEWIERGKMGWWACVTDEKDEDKWKQECNEVYKKYKGYVAVLHDLHI